MKRIFSLTFLIILSFAKLQAQDKSDSLDAGAFFGKKPKESTKNTPPKKQLKSKKVVMKDSVPSIKIDTPVISPKSVIPPVNIPDLKNIVSENDNLKRLNNNLIIAISLLLVSILLGILYYYLETMKKLKKEKKEEDIEANSLDTIEDEAVLTNDILPAPIAQNSFFISEILMTAGPRKKIMSEANSDIDLGEDVCGIITKNKEILMWLLDGTSDLHCLRNPEDGKEYFSSRLLAQCLAENLRNHFYEHEMVELDKMMNKSIESVKADWLEHINQLPHTEKEVLTKNILNKNFPECASTLLITHFSLSGELTVYRSGDSKLLTFSSEKGANLTFLDNSLASKNDESNDRIFFRLILNEQNNFEILSNKPNHEVVVEHHIKAIIAFSDGIGQYTEQFLKEQFAQEPNQARQQIIYQNQSTLDDKSICFISIHEAK